MTSRKNIFVILGFVLSVSLIASGVCEFFVSYHSCRSRFELLSSVCGEAARKDRKDPETKHQGGNERGNEILRRFFPRFRQGCKAGLRRLYGKCSDYHTG